MPIYIYLQSWPSVNFTGILAFNAGVASIGDDFCSDVDTVSRAFTAGYVVGRSAAFGNHA